MSSPEYACPNCGREVRRVRELEQDNQVLRDTIESINVTATEVQGTEMKLERAERERDEARLVHSMKDCCYHLEADLGVARAELVELRQALHRLVNFDNGREGRAAEQEYFAARKQARAALAGGQDEAEVMENIVRRTAGTHRAERNPAPPAPQHCQDDENLGHSADV